MNLATIRRYMENHGIDPDQIEEDISRIAEDMVDDQRDRDLEAEMNRREYFHDKHEGALTCAQAEVAQC